MITAKGFRRVFSVGIVLLLTGATFVSAADLKIGLINTKRVIQEAQAAKDARAAIYSDIKQKRSVFSEKQESVIGLQQQLQKEKDAAELQDYEKKLSAFGDQLKQLSRLKEDLEEELNNKNAALTQKILNDVRAIVIDYRQRNNFSLIMEADSVVTYDAQVDITDDIIRAYDAGYKKSR